MSMHKFRKWSCELSILKLSRRIVLLMHGHPCFSNGTNSDFQLDSVAITNAAGLRDQPYRFPRGSQSLKRTRTFVPGKGYFGGNRQATACDECSTVW